MNEIGQVNGTHAALPVQRTGLAQIRAAAQTEVAESGDKVEISGLATWLEKIHRLPEIRADLVDRIRAEIDAGTYTVEDKLDVTIDRLLEDLHA